MHCGRCRGVAHDPSDSVKLKEERSAGRPNLALAQPQAGSTARTCLFPSSTICTVLDDQSSGLMNC